MAKYRIPEPFLRGFELIATLKEKQVSAIKSALIEAPIGSGPDQTAQTLGDKIDLKAVERRSILSTIYSLISLKIGAEEAKEEFVDDIVTSYYEINPELKETNRKKLIDNLQILLEADGKVKQTIKAATLLRENEKIFIESRVLSDIRIVFEENISNPEQCAVILHQLKIAYHENGDPKEFFVALDNDDLKQLRENADRAIEKDKLIRNNTYKDISFIELNKK